MTELLIILFCLAAIGIVEGTRQVVRWSNEKRQNELQRRLRAVVSDAGAGQGSLLRQGKLARSAAMHSLLAEIPLALKLELLLEQADSRLTVAQLIGWTAFSGCAGIAIAAVLGNGFFVALSFAAMGVTVPFLLLVLARTRRSNKLSEQLPEALDMMSRSLRAGHALTSAFEVVATEMPEPVSVEFARAFEAQRLGLPVEQAIVQMTQRAPGNRDLKIFAVSALIQRETGGNLAEILGNIAETIRARYRFYGKLRALTAEGRASGLALAVLPFIAVGTIRLVNPGYVALLLGPGGQVIIVTAVALWLVGVAWLVKLTQVDI
jgi:tight adherence protein B